MDDDTISIYQTAKESKNLIKKEGVARKNLSQMMDFYKDENESKLS